MMKDSSENKELMSKTGELTLPQVIKTIDQLVFRIVVELNDDLGDTFEPPLPRISDRECTLLALTLSEGSSSTERFIDHLISITVGRAADLGIAMSKTPPFKPNVSKISEMISDSQEEEESNGDIFTKIRVMMITDWPLLEEIRKIASQLEGLGKRVHWEVK